MREGVRDQEGKSRGFEEGVGVGVGARRGGWRLMCPGSGVSDWD